MDAAYARLRATQGAGTRRPGRSGCRTGTRTPAASRRSTFKRSRRPRAGDPVSSRRQGAPRWQPHGRLFLGIDHTAIVVADTDASLRFYRDGLALKVVGDSENYGDEQEHLNNVFGARLRITASAPAQVAGRRVPRIPRPGDGRPTPADARCQRSRRLADADAARPMPAARDETAAPRNIYVRLARRRRATATRRSVSRKGLVSIPTDIA